MKQRRRCGGTGASIYLCFLFRTGGFCSSKICICAVPTSQNSPVLLPQKRVCRHTLPCCRVRRQLLSRVSRKQRYNTLDFAEQNRVPTGMLRAPIGNPAAKGYSLCNPSFSSLVHIQTAKRSLQCLLRKCKRKPAQVRGTDFLLDGNAEEGNGSFRCIPAIRTAHRLSNYTIAYLRQNYNKKRQCRTDCCNIF